jgi:hypothetical protein
LFGNKALTIRSCWVDIGLQQVTVLPSLSFENEDVRLESTRPLNSHGQRLAVWRKLDMLFVGHLAISLLSELERAGIYAGSNRSTGYPFTVENRGQSKLKLAIAP